MPNIKVAVINQSTVLTDDEVKPVVDALQIQVSQHFAPIWGIDADITFYARDNAVPVTSWQLVFLDNADQAGALGYHDVTNLGLPLGKAFAGTDKQYGSSWSVTASHELLEMLGDPDINLTAFVENKDGSGILYAYEVCDACEDDSLGYYINDVLVSDFVYPSWFETFHPAGTQYDYRNKITQPFQLLAGGYISIYNITAGAGWTQKTAESATLHYKMRAPIGSRRERRRTPKSQWIKSNEIKNLTTAELEIADGSYGGADITVTFNLGGGQINATQARNGNVIDSGSVNCSGANNCDGGTITFDDVRKSDKIIIDGTTAGSVDVTISGVQTSPTASPHTFPEGPILPTGFKVI